MGQHTRADSNLDATLMEDPEDIASENEELGTSDEAFSIVTLLRQLAARWNVRVGMSKVKLSLSTQ
jgi:hypothetical protein